MLALPGADCPSRGGSGRHSERKLSGTDDLVAIRAGGKPALAQALAQLEAKPDAPETLDLLDAAWADPRAHVIGLTGPPGVGKSTLMSALITRWRQDGQTVGVIAIDPSSKRTGGALLGDRTRLQVDPEDQGIFVRSLAARDSLGGLAHLAIAMAQLMRAVFDKVLIETVGVGQSETDIEALADTIIFCIQPGSGDSLQFMKAGIMELPDLFLINKADLGAIANRAAADVKGALSLTESVRDGWTPPVLTLSAAKQHGLEAVSEALEEHWGHLAGDRLTRRRRTGTAAWLRLALRHEFGRTGLARFGAQATQVDERPFLTLARWSEALS